MMKLQIYCTEIVKTATVLEAVRSDFSMAVSSEGQGGTQGPNLGSCGGMNGVLQTTVFIQNQVA